MLLNIIIECVCCYLIEDVGTTDESKDSGSSNVAAIVVPVVLLLLILPAVVVALLFYWRCVHYLFYVPYCIVNSGQV